MTARDITLSLGRDRLAERLGVTVHAVRIQEQRGYLPASWFVVCREMGAEVGIDVPESAFSWKGVEAAE